MTPQVLTHISAGQVTWLQCPGDLYHVTGVTPRGQRYRIVTPSWRYASGINQWRGSVWLVRNGKRYRIRTTYN